MSPLFGNNHPFDDAAEAQFEQLRNPHGYEMDQMHLRYLLSTCPEFYDVSRMSDAEVRRHVGEMRSMGRLPGERGPDAPEPARPSVQPTAVVPVVAAAATAARAPVTEEKRYTLLVALAYKAHRLFLNRVAAFKCKLENEFTGPESRRSGPITSSDAAFNAVRRRELRAGGYTLALTRPPLTARKLKALRTKP